MRPVLFHIGSVPIFSYGVFILLGMILLFVMTARLATANDYKLERSFPVGLGVLVGAFLGARLSHFMVEPGNLKELLEFYSLFRPGTPGNILGIMLGGYLGGLAVRTSLELPSTGNYFAPALAAASVVWRVGCTLAGCCHGKETTLPWGMIINGESHHPTMVYELIFNLFMLGVIWRLRPFIKRDNALLYIYFAAYTLFRFWLEFIRLYPPIAFGLTGIQLICISVWVWLAIWWWRRYPLGRTFESREVSL
ncbi:MAG: hypothetical protein DWQ04_24145 [Chloroflexi bacterium]|nr:MAG: hypothetical protein DWQ04_24145 [Chloroflexota bacterium]